VKPLEQSTHPEIEAALEQLRGVIRRTVRAEQLVDQLTKLSNDDALNEWIQSNIEAGDDFWLAFVEVDRFKSVNDEFGYDDADVLLRRIAGQRGARRLRRLPREVHGFDPNGRSGRRRAPLSELCATRRAAGFASPIEPGVESAPRRALVPVVPPAPLSILFEPGGSARPPGRL